MLLVRRGRHCVEVVGSGSLLQGRFTPTSSLPWMRFSNYIQHHRSRCDFQNKKQNGLFTTVVESATNDINCMQKYSYSLLLYNLQEYSYSWAGETFTEIATYKPDMSGRHQLNKSTSYTGFKWSRMMSHKENNLEANFCRQECFLWADQAGKWSRVTWPSPKTSWSPWAWN